MVWVMNRGYPERATEIPWWRNAFRCINDIIHSPLLVYVTYPIYRFMPPTTTEVGRTGLAPVLYQDMDGETCSVDPGPTARRYFLVHTISNFAICRCKELRMGLTEGMVKL